MNMKNKMHTGELYLPGDTEIIKWQIQCLDRLYDFNNTRPTEFEKRAQMLKEMFAEIGDNCYIEPPFHANFGGAHIHFGKNIYCNFGVTMADDTHIYVGDYTMFGPNVIVATAGHPILPELREQGYQSENGDPRLPERACPAVPHVLWPAVSGHKTSCLPGIHPRDHKRKLVPGPGQSRPGPVGGGEVRGTVSSDPAALWRGKGLQDAGRLEEPVRRTLIRENR